MRSSAMKTAWKRLVLRADGRDGRWSTRDALIEPEPLTRKSLYVHPASIAAAEFTREPETDQYLEKTYKLQSIRKSPTHARSRTRQV